MKTRNTILCNVVIALIFLLGPGAAQAQTIQTSDGGLNATGILGLVVDGTPYDVTFEEGVAASSLIYGPAPGIYTFDTNTTAAEASDAVNVVLESDAMVQFVGPEGRLQFETYFIGFRFREVGAAVVDVWQNVNDVATGWIRRGDDEFDFDFLVYKADERVYAVFHIANDTPPDLALSVSTLTPLITTGSDGQDFVGVGNLGGQTLNYTAAVNQTWLSLDPDNGSVTGGVASVTVNYTTAGLAEGDHNATITVTAAGASSSPQVIDVTLTVTPAIVVVTDDNKEENATAILNLIVNDDLYDVVFERATPEAIYGSPPVFDFPGEEEAEAAVDAVTDALNGAGRIKTVRRVSTYTVGFNLFDGLVDVIEGEEVLMWQRNNNPSTRGYGTEYTYAVFEPLGGAPPPLPEPTIDFSADPETVEVGQPSTLSWFVTDATTCTGSLGSGVWPGPKTLSSMEEVSPPETSTYRLTCDGDGGQSDAELIVAVLDPTTGTTSARQTKKVNTISELAYGPAGTYMKPGFPLELPQSSKTGNTLLHDGGSFNFSSPQTPTTYTYSNWTFEIRSTCAANGDPCLVQTDEGTPWALRDVGLVDGTARMVFTAEGADAFNDLVGGAPSTVQVFVTSQSFPGDLKSSAGEFTGLDGADTICTNAAKAASPPLDGAWTAWLSDGNLDVIDRMFDTEFRLLDGTLIATSLDDLTDGTLQAPINLDENLDSVPAGFNSQVWTATDENGRYGNSGTCSKWTSSDGATFSGQIGDLSSVFAGWTDVGAGNSCDKVNRLYCFSASTFLPEETFATPTFVVPEPSGAALATAALTTLGIIGARRASRRRRR